MIKLLLLVACTIYTRLGVVAKARLRALPPWVTFLRMAPASLVTPRCSRLLVNREVNPSPVLPRSILVHRANVLVGAVIRPLLPLAFTSELTAGILNPGSRVFLNRCVTVTSPQPRWVDLRPSINKCPDRRLLAAAATANIECG